MISCLGKLVFMKCDAAVKEENEWGEKGAECVMQACRFLLHRIVQVVGLICASAGFILAVAKFEALDLDDSVHRNHRALGITVMIFGWFQPLNALIRPHPPKEGEEKPALRLGWEILHKVLGYLTLILAVITIFLGLKIGETFPPFSDEDHWRSTYIGLLAAVLVVWALLLVNHFLRKKRLANKKSSEHGSEMKAHLAPTEVHVGTTPQ
jgi:cytochrome b561